jgi:hypothetical protein
MEEDQNPTGPDLGYLLAPTTAEDYETMPASEVLRQGVTNLPGSIYEAGKGIVTAVANPIETGKALGQAGYGLGSMAYGALGGQQDPAAKAENEALARAMIEPYTSVAAFKKELATNPVGPLSMLLPAAGTALKVPAALGASGRVGSGLAQVGKAVDVSSAFVDPARALVEGAGAVKKFGPLAATAVPQMLTGSPDAAFEYAFKAGAERGLDAKAIRDGFNQYYKGSGNVVGLSQDIEKAISQLKASASKDWLSTRGQVTGAATAPIDYSGVRSALDDAYKNFGGVPGTQTSAFPGARAALADAEALIREYAKDAPGTGKNTLAGLDELKRALKARADAATAPETQQAYLQVHGSVRETLGNISPEYSALMDDYTTLLDEMKTLKNTMGAGPRMDANAQLSKAMKALKTPGGVDYLEKIAAIDPTIPYKIAGAALHNNPTGLRQVIVSGSSVAPFVTNALLSGDPAQMAAAVPALVGGIAVSSPKFMGKTAYGAGRLGAGIGAMGDIPIAPGATVGNLVSGASNLAYPGALAAEQLQFAQNKVQADQPPALEFSDGTSMTIAEPGQSAEDTQSRPPLVVDVYPPGDPRNAPQGQASGGRIQRKSGGRIGNAISTEVDRTRALLGNKTASMLSMPDDAIVTALNHAKNT